MAAEDDLNLAIVKKRRARKRRRNDDMGDLDMNLIQEFSKRPVFYDRRDANFRNKEYLQKCWEEISMNLGYDVSMLKSRIYQLRNRYNLEKRRLQILRAENPDNPSVESPWALFSHLQFLEVHIKPRRIYRKLLKQNDSTNANDSSANLDRLSSSSSTSSPTSSSSLANVNDNLQSSYGEAGVSEDILIMEENHNVPKDLINHNEGNNNNDNDNSLAALSTNLIENVGIKCEVDLDENGSENRTEHQAATSNAIEMMNAGNPQSSSTLLHTSQQTVLQQKTLREQQLLQNLVQNRQRPAISVRNISQLRSDQNHSQRHPQNQNQRKEKYEAFGQFVSTSLCDMSEDKALHLVGKLTTEIVRALIENHNRDTLNNLFTE